MSSLCCPALVAANLRRLAVARLRALLPLAVLLTLVLLCAAAPAAAAQKRIIGGSNVSIESHPYQVKVETGLGNCGGSIRDASHVITAAHCVVDEERFFPLIPRSAGSECACRS